MVTTLVLAAPIREKSLCDERLFGYRDRFTVHGGIHRIGDETLLMRFVMQRDGQFFGFIH